MSEVIAFCERHGLTRMQNLLLNCGEMTPVREMYAIQVLEELVANDPVKVGALRQLSSRINPVETRARFRITVKEREAQMLEATMKKEAIISQIERLRLELLRMKVVSPPPQAEEHETQAFEVVEDDTQPKAFMNQAEALRLLAQPKK